MAMLQHSDAPCRDQTNVSPVFGLKSTRVVKFLVHWSRAVIKKQTGKPPPADVFGCLPRTSQEPSKSLPENHPMPGLAKTPKPVAVADNRPHSPDQSMGQRFPQLSTVAASNSALSWWQIIATGWASSKSLQVSTQNRLTSASTSLELLTWDVGALY